jgi:hypothetical protein
MIKTWEMHQAPRCRQCGESLAGPLYVFWLHEPRCTIMDELKAMYERCLRRSADLRLLGTGIRVVRREEKQG